MNARTGKYSAIAACIGEERGPNPRELKRVAARMLREAFEDPAAASFSMRRAVLRAARVALRGE